MSVFNNKDKPGKRNDDEVKQLRRIRRDSVINFPIDSNIKFYRTFTINQNEKIHHCYSINPGHRVPLYQNGNKYYYVNGDECPKIPTYQSKNSETKTIEILAMFSRKLSNIEIFFNGDFDKIINYKSVASIKKYQLLKTGTYPYSTQTFKRLNDFAVAILNKVKEARINQIQPTKTNTLSFTFDSNGYPYRSYNKLSSLYDDFDKNKYQAVKHYNDFSVKDSKKDYSLRTYSKVKNTFIGDIFFESNKAAFLLLINVNTRYAYAYQLGEVNTKEIINVDDNNKEYEMTYATNGKKTNESLIKAFEQHLSNPEHKINILRFDGEKAVQSNKFKKLLKDNNIVFVPAITEAHTSLSLIDRLCRTIRDIAFNLNYPGIYSQQQMDIILNFYNKSRHETLTKVIFKSHPEIKQQLTGGIFSPPPFISPAMVNDSDELEKIFVEECMKHNFNIISSRDYKLDMDDKVKITSEKSKLGKKRSILDKDLYKVSGMKGNIYELTNTKTNKKVYKPRFEIFNFD